MTELRLADGKAVTFRRVHGLGGWVVVSDV